MAKKGPSRRRRQFSDEFKAGAIRLVIEDKRALSEVAKELGLPVSTLSQWVMKEEERLGIRREVVAAPPGLTADERTELEQLRKRVRELETEKAILKKAAAYSTGRRNTVTSESWLKEVLHAGSQARLGRKREG